LSGGLRAAVESRMVRYWDAGPRSDPPLTLALAPLAGLYRAAVGARGWAFDRGIRSAHPGGIPVVSVGNLAVGGTGKTPVTRWLVEHLAASGFRPAIVTRGYGEDEIWLHRRWNPQVPVIASPDRVRGAQQAAALGCGLVVLDDGFQHRRIQREVDLVLLSPGHPHPVRVLPLGPYREPLQALKRASHLFLVCKGARERDNAEAWEDRLRDTPGLPEVHRIDLIPGGWQDLEGEVTPAPDGRVLLLSSVARPASVRALAEEAGLEVVDEMAFPDHHPYREDDAMRIARRAQGSCVVTTEKDAVKLHVMKNLLPPIRVLTLTVAPPTGGRGGEPHATDPRLSGILQSLPALGLE
jgi:tetraacyldisaccharide 4'-kinase